MTDEGKFHLTEDEVVKIKTNSAVRWNRDGVVNLRGGIDPMSGEVHSPWLNGATVKKLVIGPLSPKLAGEIKHLDISNNPQLESVGPQEELAKLKSLKVLEFKYSERTEIPTWIKHLPVVETILMGVNQVTFLPSWITDKSGMKVISLFMNQLREIESFGGIEELNIGSNRYLEQLPPLKPGSPLKDLEAERCNLQELPKDIFSGNLIKCVINHNPEVGTRMLPYLPRNCHLRLFSATFCGYSEVPPELIRPEMFIKL